MSFPFGQSSKRFITRYFAKDDLHLIINGEHLPIGKVLEILLENAGIDMEALKLMIEMRKEAEE